MNIEHAKIVVEGTAKLRLNTDTDIPVSSAVPDNIHERLYSCRDDVYRLEF